MSDVFDLLIEQQSMGKGSEEEAVMAGSMPAKATSDEIPWYKSIPADILKGIIGGVVNFGRAFGPLPDVAGEKPYNPDDLRNLLDENIPSSPTFLGGAARRGLEMFPTASMLPGVPPGAMGVASGAGGVLGEGVKEVGGGEVAQTIAEVIPSFFTGSPAPIAEKGTKVFKALGKTKALPEKMRDIFSKKALDREEINEIIRFAKSKGMTSEELAPLIQPEMKKTVLSKLASRGGDTQKALSRSKQAVEDIADSFSKGEYAAKTLSPEATTKFTNALEEVIYEMPAKTSDLIKEDLSKLKKSPMDVKSIVRFFRAINAQYGADKARLGLLKGPIKDALATISPQLANDFNMSNKLFQKYYDISSKLKPNMASDFFEYLALPKALYGAVTGNYPLLVETVGEHAARKFSAELLTNPKLYDLSRQIVAASKSGKVAAVEALRRQYAKEIRKAHPKISEAMLKESFEEFAGEQGE